MTHPSSSSVIFHVAFPVANIPTTKDFYVNGLGCEPGRESPHSIILNLYNHQIVAHTTKDLVRQKGIYPRHFGLVFLQESDWEDLCDRALTHNLKFYQHPKRRFPGSPLDHRTFFLEDPFFNLLEFKYYYNYSAIFGELDHTQVGDSL